MPTTPNAAPTEIALAFRHSGLFVALPPPGPTEFLPSYLIEPVTEILYACPANETPVSNQAVVRPGILMTKLGSVKGTQETGVAEPGPVTVALNVVEVEPGQSARPLHTPAVQSVTMVELGVTDGPPEITPPVDVTVTSHLSDELICL